jgi:hypothetical protein
VKDLKKIKEENKALKLQISYLIKILEKIHSDEEIMIGSEPSFSFSEDTEVITQEFLNDIMKNLEKNPHTRDYSTFTYDLAFFVHSC